MSRLTIVPITLRAARAYVDEHHRHHLAPRGGLFAAAVQVPDAEPGGYCGVVIVGRPVARHYQDGLTAEVTRCCTDGTPNACSLLYAAAWRAAKALGWRRLITYTQAVESGSSLRGAGWKVLAERPPTTGWDRPSRPRQDHGADGIARTLWGAA